MSHQLIPDLARVQRTDHRRSAGQSRLVALAQCCRPSRVRAALRAFVSPSARPASCGG